MVVFKINVVAEKLINFLFIDEIESITFVINNEEG